MNQLLMKAPCIGLTKINTIFIEMTAGNCNLKCKDCYMGRFEKKVKDFIPFDTIKRNIESVDKTNLEYICFTGGEPMLHPDFNKILRFCLNYCSVIIYTNAMNINDKKARFLKKVEEENKLNNEIIFMISIDKPDEKENDEIRGRGSFRKALHAIQSLIKYDFNPIITSVNHDNIPPETLKAEFKKICNEINFETTDINFKILPLLKKEYNTEPEPECGENLKPDCAVSRTLTKNGIFTCPLLSEDNRGKCGSDFKDFEKRIYLETGYCAQCIKHGKELFILNENT